MRKMEMQMVLEASYKDVKIVYVAELGVKDDSSLVTVTGEWVPMWSKMEFAKAGGLDLLEPVFQNRVNSALCLVNNLKLSHLKYRYDNVGCIDLTGYNYKSGLRVNTELLVKVI